MIERSSSSTSDPWAALQCEFQYNAALGPQEFATGLAMIAALNAVRDLNRSDTVSDLALSKPLSTNDKVGPLGPLNCLAHLNNSDKKCRRRTRLPFQILLRL